MYEYCIYKYIKILENQNNIKKYIKYATFITWNIDKMYYRYRLYKR